MSENQAAYPIATMCRLLGVPPPAAIMRGRSECRRGVHKQMLCCSRRSGQRMRPRMATSERRDPSLRPGFAIPLHRVRAALPGGGRALDGLGPRCLRQRHVPKASLPRWSASCLLGAGSTAKPRRARRSSSSSKASIIAAAAIPRSAISRRSITSTSMPPIPTRNSLPSCSRPSRTSPFGRPQVAVLDSRSARRLRTRAGRNGRMASPGAEPKNVAKQKDEMTSHHIP